MTLEEVSSLVRPYGAEDVLETLRTNGMIEFYFIKGNSVKIWENIGRRVDIAMFSDATIEQHREDKKNKPVPKVYPGSIEPAQLRRKRR